MAARSLQAPSARAALYGAMHLLVDACTVTAVWRTGDSQLVSWLSSFWVIFGYDVVAFATQAPLGLLVDRRGLSRTAVFAGLGLTTLGLLLVDHSTLATLLAASLGNSLFHLGAGASVLRSCGRRAFPAGLFVGPGAVGLGLGSWMGRTGIGPTWPLIALLGLSFALVDLAHSQKDPEGDEAASVPDLTAAARWLALALLFFSVMIRSYVGFGACHECEKGTTLLLVGIPLAALLGKASGGFIADRIGWLGSSVGALLLSAPLLAFNAGNTPVALAGLVLFQMTMPVTVMATSHLLPDRPATAFGLPSLALVVGALPTFFPQGQIFSSGTFLVLIVASAAALLVALRLLGALVKPLKDALAP
ncbi:MAG TPA: hypothetical protein VGK67_00240 [Myxococcales bacterium]